MPREPDARNVFPTTCCRRTPMMRSVRLEMARCHEFPDGSSTHGYELHLPLTLAGKLDRDFWLKHRQGGGFHRFWGDIEDRGRLRHGRKGWALLRAATGR